MYNPGKGKPASFICDRSSRRTVESQKCGSLGVFSSGAILRVIIIKDSVKKWGGGLMARPQAA